VRDTAGPVSFPSPARVASALDVHIWSSGHGYTKAEVHWTQGLVASQTAHRTLLPSAFTPAVLTDMEDALAILVKLLGDLTKEK